jgi:hypothetical protein
MDFAAASPPLHVGSIVEAKAGPDSNGIQLYDCAEKDANQNIFFFLCQLAKSDYCGLHSSSDLLKCEQVVWGTSLGKGAYAVVHAAQKEQGKSKGLLPRPAIAVKQLKTAVAEDTVELKCFLLEAHILSTLNHPCVFDFFRSGSIC